MNSEEIDPKAYKNTGVKRLFKALYYSFEGIASSFKHEAAFRQEALLACVLIPLSFLLRVELTHHLFLVGSVLLILIVELLNSGIEAVVDDISMKNRPLAKRAKDMGSAAVLIALLNCFICWVSVIVVNWDRLVS
ncbi:diacylglycerol kinase [Coraliomargarita parva]|uniref:diacylglycerol kinase n=1 Tax=Coraliomargarita parva TaxID=3014050 RepID=UPI0022B3000D|nr:diacylglycerol kinase [Coraliomargarita parva]